MSLLFNVLSITLFCAVLGLSPRIPVRGRPVHLPGQHDLTGLDGLPGQIKLRKDVPLTVRLVKVGDRYATFNITGNDSVNGKPITHLFVNYTVDGPTVKLQTVELTSENSDGIFSKVVQVTGFQPGQQYEMQFAGENDKGEKGPSSSEVSVLLLPPTPDITVLHPSLQKLKVIWGEKRTQNEDYYLLTVEKKSAPGCGLTVNLTRCFGKSYALDELEVGQTYVLTMVAHNPSGFSDPVVVSYPIE